MDRKEKYERRQARKAEKERLLELERQEQERQQLKKDIRFMKQAITQAKKAAAIGEVPIGCVIVKDDQVIARGYNRRNADHNTLSHAETVAIRRAGKKLQDWRLEGCTMYVTLEPCQMCSGALVQSRIDRVVIGCDNPKAGCAGSIINLLEMPQFNHQVTVARGILEEECSRVLKDFFKELRAGKAAASEVREIDPQDIPEPGR